MSKTERNQELLVEQLKKTPIVQLACEKSGVSRATYYRWRKESDEFSEAADLALTESVALMNDMAESQLLSSIRDGNLTGIIFWLKNRHSAYATRVQVDATHRLVDEKLTPEQQEVVEEALRLSGISKGGDDGNSQES